MRNIVPKIAAIHDISGYGRCSMTVIQPVISALGCQVCPLPTAILSNHSAFKNFYFYDFTDHMEDYYEGWQANDISFDCVYTGFIGSEAQIDIIIDIIDKMKKTSDTMVVVDPVMGDHGKVYKTYTKQMIEKMNKLVKTADIITPNLTEVSILLGEQYHDGKTDKEALKSYLKRLSDMGPETVVITGVETKDNHVNVCYSRKADKFYEVSFDYIDVKFPGTGDLFTSLFIGYMYRGKSIPEAIEEASRFVAEAVKYSVDKDIDRKNGVLFEAVMEKLYQEKKAYNYKKI